MLWVLLFNGLLEIVGGNPREEGKTPLSYPEPNVTWKVVLLYQPVARVREEVFLRGKRIKKSPKRGWDSKQILS